MSLRRQHGLQFLRSLFVCTRAACTLVLLGVLIVVLYLATVGFPPWLVRKIVTRLNYGNVAVHARVVKLVPPFALSLKDVHLYARHVLGPPILEARSLHLGLSLRRCVQGQFPIEEVTISDAMFRPELIPVRPDAPPAPPVNLPIQVHVALINCGFRGLVIESFEGDVHVAGTAVEVRDEKGALQHAGRRGTFGGQTTYDWASRKLVGRVATQFDPHLLIPLMRAMNMSFTRELTERFNFGPGFPTTDLWFERTPGDKGELRLGGTFKASDASYVGVPVREAAGGLEMTFSATNSVVRVQPLHIVREEGEAQGGFTVTVAPEVGKVDFDAASSLHPEALLRLIGLIRQNATVPYRFEAPFRISLRGTADFFGMTNTLFTGRVACGGIGLNLLPVRDCSFDLQMAGTTCRCDNVNGTLYGGNLSQNIEIIFPQGASTGTVYKARGSLTRADFATCVQELTQTSMRDLRGALSGTFDLVGHAEDPELRQLTGTGTVRIKDGRIFMLPVFGGLSKYLVRIIPGLDVLIRQTDANTSFTLGGGKAVTEKILIEGDVLSLSGRGTYAFSGDIDFEVQVKLMKEHTLVAKLLRALTYPISKLFEFRLRGNLSAPHWSPVNLPKELLESLGLVDESNDGTAKLQPGAAGKLYPK